CAGLDYNRMVMLLAVIEKNLDISLGNKDIYINVAGGMKVGETAADLPLAVAIVSAVKDKPVKPGVAAIGEIGLTGEMRFASHIDKRLAELEKMGFTDCIVPKANSPLHYKGKINVHFADTIGDISKLGSVLYG
ncbi:MAG: DNA repair protein RadA, partial [Clostridia bacterium]|nr:DNA repair protein RadA [Clostridia bacterium]